jgi:hypothetical protein
MEAEEGQAEEESERLAEEGDREAGDEACAGVLAWEDYRFGSELQCELDCNAPSMLPSVICLTAFAFRPPRLLTTGACALFWYCENDQSLGLVEDEVIGLDPLSRRRGLRCWWESRPYAAPERPSAAVAQLKSGRWRRKAILGEEMCVEVLLLHLLSVKVTAGIGKRVRGLRHGISGSRARLEHEFEGLDLIGVSNNAVHSLSNHLSRGVALVLYSLSAILVRINRSNRISCILVRMKMMLLLVTTLT